MKPLLFLVISLCSATLADNLSPLYEKAYFLETAKGQPGEALALYSRIISTEATPENRAVIIQALERSLILRRREQNNTLQQKVDGFAIRTDEVQRIIATFGEPEGYVNFNRIYTATNLPSMFTMSYPDGFSINIMSGKIHELRFRQPNYRFNGITVGTPLEKVLELYPPKKTVEQNLLGSGSPKDPDVFYRNVYGTEGTHAYKLSCGLRLFFVQDKVYSIALFDPLRPAPAP